MSASAIVVGAGVFGVWTAYHLQRLGMQVTLVDAYEPGHSRASSGDESRILRCGYGPDELYVRLAHRSREHWRALHERRVGRDPALWHQCGVLWLAAGHDRYTADTLVTLRRGDQAVDVLDSQQLAARYPQLDAEGITLALLESDGGVLSARRAVQVVRDEVVEKGGMFLKARVAAPSNLDRRVTRVACEDGRILEGDIFVFACGPWLPAVFPSLMTGLIRPTRQVVVYFGVPAGDERFGAQHLPAWVDFPAGIYGVPDLDGRGLKVGIDAHGPPFDPDSDDRLIDAASVERARAWVRRRFQALAHAPVVEGRVCQYENTSTGDFLIDRHPDHDNVWIVGGGSGHGFKHGPAVGEDVAGQIAGERAAEPRFTLAAKTRESRRTVF